MVVICSCSAFFRCLCVCCRFWRIKDNKITKEIINTFITVHCYILMLCRRQNNVITAVKCQWQGVRNRVGHGLDPSMDWIGFYWVRILRKLCGLDWVR